MSNELKNEQSKKKSNFNIYEWARKRHILIYFGLAVALVHTASFFYKIEDESERWLMLPSAILIECFLAFLSYYAVKKDTPGGARAVSIILGLIFLLVSGYLQRDYYIKAHNDVITATIFGALIPLAIAGMSLFLGSYDFADEINQQKTDEKNEAIRELTEERDHLRGEVTRLAQQEADAQRREQAALNREQSVQQQFTELQYEVTEIKKEREERLLELLGQPTAINSGSDNGFIPQLGAGWSVTGNLAPTPQTEQFNFNQPLLFQYQGANNRGVSNNQPSVKASVSEGVSNPTGVSGRVNPVTQMAVSKPAGVSVDKTVTHPLATNHRGVSLALALNEEVEAEAAPDPWLGVSEGVSNSNLLTASHSPTVEVDGGDPDTDTQNNLETRVGVAEPAGESSNILQFSHHFQLKRGVGVTQGLEVGVSNPGAGVSGDTAQAEMQQSKGVSDQQEVTRPDTGVSVESVSSQSVSVAGVSIVSKSDTPSAAFDTLDTANCPKGVSELANDTLPDTPQPLSQADVTQQPAQLVSIYGRWTADQISVLDNASLSLRQKAEKLWGNREWYKKVSREVEMLTQARCKVIIEPTGLSEI